MQLSQLTGTSANPLVTQIFNLSPTVEPLGGPIPVEDLMDRFPPEVYQQGRDTHLWKLLTALCGDAGAGLIQRQSYAARLKYEAEFVNFQVLDDIYSSQYQIHRLASEVPSVDLNEDAVTPGQSDAADVANLSYYHRAQEFFTATRSGNSPDGLQLAAQAGSGVATDLIENYNYVFDQYSDLALGLQPLGHTTSTSEFIVATRGDVSSEYTAPWYWGTTYTAPVISANQGRPAPLTSALSAARIVVNTPTQQLTPELERNMLDLLDRLRPASALSTTIVQDDTFVDVPLNTTPFASSERLYISRFVEGLPSVNWPSLDPQQGFFIETGVENEATSFYGTAAELPVLFQTITSVVAYTDLALADPTYGTDSFYLDGTPIPPIAAYLSEHIGVFFQTLIAIFPFLSQIDPSTSFLAENALANQNTMLVAKGQAV